MSATVAAETTEELTSFVSTTTTEAAITTAPTNTNPDCFGVELTTVSYGSEISWSLGTCLSAATYDNNNVYNEQCCLSPGTYTLTCQDSYGDGWNGGSIEIQGQTYCEDFTSGASVTREVTVHTGKYIKYSDCQILFISLLLHYRYICLILLI